MRGGIGGRGGTRIARRRQRHVARTKLRSTGDGHRQATRLERAGRIRALVLDEQLAALEPNASGCPRRRDQRRSALAEAQREAVVAHRQQLTVPPQVPRATIEGRRRHLIPQRGQVVAGEEDLAAARTGAMERIGFGSVTAGGAFEVRKIGADHGSMLAPQAI